MTPPPVRLTVISGNCDPVVNFSFIFNPDNNYIADGIIVVIIT